MYLEATFGILTLAALYLTWMRRQRGQMVQQWERKHVFITGCDTGFGRELALRLDSRGVPVWAGCLTPGGATELQEAASGKLQTVAVDVTKTQSVRDAFEYIRCRLPSDGGTYVTSGPFN